MPAATPTPHAAGRFLGRPGTGTSSCAGLQAPLLSASSRSEPTATTDASAYAFVPNFVEVYAYPNSPGPLQTRDRVIGVNGITMREWAVRPSCPTAAIWRSNPTRWRSIALYAKDSR
ncbi:MAG: hypothetical protein U0X20_11330 [Caldilineaceae bacterium]